MMTELKKFVNSLDSQKKDTKVVNRTVNIHVNIYPYKYLNMQKVQNVIYT